MDNEFWFRRLRFPFDEKDLSPAELEKLRLVMETRQEVKDAYTRLENARNSARMVYTVRMYKHSQEIKKCLEDISYLEEKLENKFQELCNVGIHATNFSWLKSRKISRYVDEKDYIVYNCPICHEAMFEIRRGDEQRIKHNMLSQNPHEDVLFPYDSIESFSTNLKRKNTIYSGRLAFYNENRGAIFIGRNVAETLRKILKTQEYQKIKDRNNGKIDVDELIEDTLNQIDVLEKVTKDYKRLLDEIKMLCLIFGYDFESWMRYINES